MHCYCMTRESFRTINDMQGIEGRKGKTGKKGIRGQKGAGQCQGKAISLRNSDSFRFIVEGPKGVLGETGSIGPKVIEMLLIC